MGRTVGHAKAQRCEADGGQRAAHAKAQRRQGGEGASSLTEGEGTHRDSGLESDAWGGDGLIRDGGVVGRVLNCIENRPDTVDNRRGARPAVTLRGGVGDCARHFGAAAFGFNYAAYQCAVAASAV
jgi:hypothetical protein